MASTVQFIAPIDEPFATCEVADGLARGTIEELYDEPEDCKGDWWVVRVNGTDEAIVCTRHKAWAKKEYTF